MLEVPFVDSRGQQQTVPSNAAPPFPPSYKVRGTCGVTFIAPHFAITAGHCLGQTLLPDPNLVFPVYTYDISAVVETWHLEATAINQGTFPNYAPLGPGGGATAADIPGYERRAYSCFLKARCGWGPNYNCPPDIAGDIALVYCFGRDVPPEWLPGATEDPRTGPVEMYWFHELLSMPTSKPSGPDPDENDRFDHYTSLKPGEQARNFHYLDSNLNAILPLKSIPWPDGTPRTRILDPGEGVVTDLFGCHGTSGSGVLQVSANGEYELLGPAVAGNDNTWQQTNLCTDPDDPEFQPGKRYNLRYTANTYTKKLEEAFIDELKVDREL